MRILSRLSRVSTHFRVHNFFLPHFPNFHISNSQNFKQVFTKKVLNIGASRIKLLGVLYAGPVLSADGSIEVIPIPKLYTIQTRTDIPINLGYVIKAEKLREFEALFEIELKKTS